MEVSGEQDKSDAVDAALQQWRQGDCVLGDQGIIHRFDPRVPLTPEAVVAATQGTDLAEQEVAGLVIVTQSCDVVRKCGERPFIEVSPLVEVSQEDIKLIQLKMTPRYAYVPAVAAKLLVADLDRVMTIEKAIVARWARLQGCNTDPEIRDFSEALGRKRTRFAFPNDFNKLVRDLQDRIQKKHGRQSDEGAALLALDQIRVRAAPSWNAEKVELMFWFIRDAGEPNFKGSSWAELREKWLKLVPPSGRFATVDALVATLRDISAQDYVDSDLLDLDYLSR